tara:strand:+ start:741 stop:884 length:144 start_codon:yes stop_codon:yes gene_type:complete
MKIKDKKSFQVDSEKDIQSQQEEILAEIQKSQYYFLNFVKKFKMTIT